MKNKTFLNHFNKTRLQVLFAPMSIRWPRENYASTNFNKCFE